MFLSSAGRLAPRLSATSPLRTMSDLWRTDSPEAWKQQLDRYESVVDRQDVRALPDHDRWYREELPQAIAARDPAHITHPELVRLAEWKMARGVWRPRNLVLVKGNEPDTVESTSASALSQIPHPTKPIATLTRLAGVGPATASAVAAATAPDIYPFFDELVAAQVPGLGPVVFTMAYYGKYAAALRERARKLGVGWSPVRVERALWANSGGKAGRRER
jgi:DNA uptake protein ComE-like DNA-binding protein